MMRFMTQYPKVLFVSDVHIGAKTSDFSAYKQDFLEKIKAYKHVVFGGDIIEAFYVKRHKGQTHDNLIAENLALSVAELEATIRENTNTQFHYVIGNHDNIDVLRDELKRLQAESPNFEWHPQGIKLEDTLVMHGDLAFKDITEHNHGDTDITRKIYTLEEAQTKREQKGMLYTIMDKPGHEVAKHLRNKKTATKQMHSFLTEKNASGDFIIQENRREIPLEMDRISNIVFGHTHVGFYNNEHRDKFFHNTGAIVQHAPREKVGKQTFMPGMLEADIVNGSLCNFRPVALHRDKQWQKKVAPQSLVLTR